MEQPAGGRSSNGSNLICLGPLLPRLYLQEVLESVTFSVEGAKSVNFAEGEGQACWSQQ